MLGDYDALLVVSFGGPEAPDEVMPFLERVTKGRGVPRERLEEVAAHYALFEGKSPIHERTRELIAALGEAIPELPIYWGNRFAAPFLPEAIAAMRQGGVRRAVAFVTSALPSYSSCRAYLDDIARARVEVGEGAPIVEKLRPFAAHPGYAETCALRLGEALERVEDPGRARVLFSAHSIPLAMARECAYEAELERLAARVAEQLGLARWRSVYQSRSGPPEVPWLGPDVRDALRELAAEEPGASVVIAPIGFVADHMEVVYDLDVEARAEAERLGLAFARASAANAHPRFVSMVRELVFEQVRAPAACPEGCCPPPRRRVS